MLLLLAPLAAAYTLSGEALSDVQLPLEIHWTGAQPGFTSEDLEAALEGAAAAWEESAACGLDIQIVADPLAHDWFVSGGVAVLFGDPEEELSGGVMALTLRSPSSGVTFERNGTTFTESAAAAIIFGDLAGWTTDAAIAAGSCEGQLSLQAALTHELGHVLGLSDSCTEGESCPDEAEQSATMYWAMGTCDAGPSTLGSDDVAGLTALYGAPFAFAFTCEAAPDDSLTVACAVTDPADAAALAPAWDFGDGATAAGATTTHTFAAAGTYAVELCVEPPECGGPRCQSQSIEVVAGDSGDTAGSDTGGADDTAPADDADKSGCGCSSGAPAAPWLGLLLGLAIRRRR